MNWGVPNNLHHPSWSSNNQSTTTWPIPPRNRQESDQPSERVSKQKKRRLCWAEAHKQTTKRGGQYVKRKPTAKQLFPQLLLHNTSSTLKQHATEAMPQTSKQKHNRLVWTCNELPEPCARAEEEVEVKSPVGQFLRTILACSGWATLPVFSWLLASICFRLPEKIQHRFPFQPTGENNKYSFQPMEVNIGKHAPKRFATRHMTQLSVRKLQILSLASL